ncbi:MAG TPA: hypothetical protein VNW95_07815 [Mucilaginibacter sp.]|jgi:hypothetical protein|nr:hypothetical protein [Mucilaginibacter sp.]
MTRIHTIKSLLVIAVSFLLLFAVSCKKQTINSGSSVKVTPPVATPTKLGLYEADSSIYKELITVISKIGTVNIPVNSQALIFDTGSGGMVYDGTDLLPASMITTAGITFTGDSTVVNGITITKQTSIVQYGADANTIDKVYGNLAYAPVTIGDANGNIVVKRLPFFLYYKAVSAKGVTYPKHDFDTFGVSEEYDITFSNGEHITSPFSYFDPGTGLTRGFKMAAIGTSNFTLQGNYVPGVLTLGLTAADLSASSGFAIKSLSYFSGDGYAPIVPASVTYSGKTFSTQVIYDTGTEPYSYLQDPNGPTTLTLLPVGTPVTVAATYGFNYAFTTTANENLTYVENSTKSGSTVSIISLEFFLNNEYMLDFANHQLGLKNN